MPPTKPGSLIKGVLLAVQFHPANNTNIVCIHRQYVQALRLDTQGQQD